MSHTKSNWKKRGAALVISLMTFSGFIRAYPDSGGALPEQHFVCDKEKKCPLKPHSLSLQANLLR